MLGYVVKRSRMLTQVRNNYHTSCIIETGLLVDFIFSLAYSFKVV